MGGAGRVHVHSLRVTRAGDLMPLFSLFSNLIHVFCPQPHLTPSRG